MIKRNDTISRYAVFYCILLFFIISDGFSYDNSASIDTRLNVSSTNGPVLEKLKTNSLMQNTLVFYNHHLIVRFREQYSTKEGREYLSKIMQRSTPYRDFIIDLLEAENMPKELLFLPVIESGFYKKARSKSGAVGIWQFMANSVRGFDIHIDEWMDERYDPWKTSIAAIKKLKWNYSQVHDWALALAGYNCGMGALRNAIKRAGKADYWYLAEHGYLKSETVYYVPKFLAVAEILSRSDELGIDWGDTKANPPTSTIAIKRAIDLALLAKELKIDPEIVMHLNPSLYYSITPPNTVYSLRLPAVYEKQAREVLDSSDKLLLKYYQYRIKSGDTLYALSKHYGVSVGSILNYNKGLKSRTLGIGKVILIPALKSVKTYSGRKVRYDGNFDGRYIIQSGDTLWSLALKYKVPVEFLAEKNNLTVDSTLRLGYILKVPIL